MDSIFLEIKLVKSQNKMLKYKFMSFCDITKYLL